MPLHALKVPAGSNQFFAAFSLGLLLPSLDDSRFDDILENLFGRIPARALADFLGELRACTVASLPRSLEGIINTKLRPRLADYILAHQADYLEFFDSEATLLAGIEAVRSGERFFGGLEEKALARMTNTHLFMHRDATSVSAFKEYGAGDASEVSHLAMRDGATPEYECLLDPERLSTPLRRRLFPELIRDARTIRDEVYTLCNRYCDVNLFTNGDKIGVVRAIQWGDTPQDMLARLEKPCGVEGYPSLSKKDFLLRRPVHWVARALLLLLMIATFPISIPLWLFFSWAANQWDFFASRERILIKKFTALCTEKAALDGLDAEGRLEVVDVGAGTGVDLSLSHTSGLTVFSSAAAGSTTAPMAREDRFGEITAGLAGGMANFFSKMIDSQFERYTGNPMLTTYRINPSIPDSGMFSIDLKVVFRWTSQPGMRTTIRLLNEFLPPPVEHLEPFVSPVAPPLTRSQGVRQSMPFFFEREPDFAVLFQGVVNDLGTLKKGKAAAVLLLPHTEQQRIALVEEMINYYNNARRDDLISLRDHSLLSELAYIEAKAKKGIGEWLQRLPRNYQQITAEATTLKVAYQSVLALVQAGRLDEAWALFEPVSKVSAFIRFAFPHLLAMNHQFSAIFIISRHKRWDGDTRMSEYSALTDALQFLALICKTIEPYNVPQKDTLTASALAPIRQLIEAGKLAASRTSQAERERIRYERGQRGVGIFRGWDDGTYRNPLDDIDADDAPTIVEIRDDAPSPSPAP
jgi:hypothetical protein